MSTTFSRAARTLAGTLVLMASTVLPGATQWARAEANATSRTVCAIGCDYTDIQSAVDAAATGDVIKVASGTYTGVTTRNGIKQLVYLSKEITLRGGYDLTFAEPPNPGTNLTTLDAQSQGRVLYVIGAITPTIEGFRITGGNAAGLLGSTFGDAGGGVYATSARILFNNNHVYANTAKVGGGMYMLVSPSVLTGNTINNNTATDDGGGLALASSAASLVSNDINHNSAGQDGGGLHLLISSAFITGTTVFSNTAVRYGGGAYMLSSNATLQANTISSNVASTDGGGLFELGSTANVIGNLIVGNSATTGGGVRLQSSATTMLANTIMNNAAGFGGGVFLADSNNVLNRNAINRNTATFQGGGMLMNNSSPTVTNNIVAKNNASMSGSAMYITQGSQPRMLHNTIASNTGGDGSGIYVNASASTLLAFTAQRGKGFDSTNGVESVEAVPSTAYFTNTILVGHVVGIKAEQGNWAILEGTILGTGTTSNTTDFLGPGSFTTGNIVIRSDPKFVTSPNSANLPADNYHIASDSPAIGAGVVTPVLDDLDGEGRLEGHAPAIGADEMPYADVSIAQTLWTNGVPPGSPVVFTLSFSNAGSILVPGVLITDVLPAGLTNISFTSSGVAVSALPGSPYAWQVGDMPVGARGVITISANVDPAQPVDTTIVTTASIGASVVDVRPNDNTSALTLIVTKRKTYLPFVVRKP